MRPLFLIGIVLLACLSLAQADEIYGHPEVRLTTLPKATRDRIAWLHPGMKRAEVEKRFAADGGLATLFEERYYIPEVPSRSRRPEKAVMLRLTFQPGAMPDKVHADPARRDAWRERQHPSPGPSDVLRSVSKPFLSYPSAD